MASLLDFAQPIKKILETQSRPFAPLRQYQNPTYQARYNPGTPIQQAPQQMPQGLPEERMSFEQILQEAANPNQGINPLVESIKAVAAASNLSPYIRRPELLPAPVKPDVDNSIAEKIGRGIDAAGKGVWRSVGGVVSDTSGLIDTLSPGKGVSEFTKKANKINEDTDKYIAENRLPDPLYKAAQLGTNVASFLAPGAAISKVAKVSKPAAFGANVAADLAQGTGFRGARGEDISPGTLGLDAGMSAAFGGLIHASPKVAKGIKNAVTSVGREIAGPNIPTPKLRTPKADPVVKAENLIQKIEARAAAEGRKTTTYEEVKISSALKKAGIDPADVPAPNKSAIQEKRKRDIFLSSSGVISRYGDDGKRIAKGLDAKRDAAQVLEADIFKRTKSIMALDKDQFTRFVDTLDNLSAGKKVKIDPDLRAAVKESTQVMPGIRNRGVKSGLPIGQKGKYYFPRQYKDIDTKKGYNSYIKKLEDQGYTTAEAVKQATFARKASVKRYGNLEKSRVSEAPGYEKTKEAFVDYIGRASERIAHAEQFGANDEVISKAKERLLKQGVDISPNSDFSKALDVALELTDKNTKGHKISGKLREFNALTSLSSAGISNATQMANTAEVAGFTRTAKSTYSRLKKDPRAARIIEDSGVAFDSSIKRVKEGQIGTTNRVTSNVASPAFTSVERFNREATAVVGADWGQDLAKKAAKGDVKALQELREGLGVTGKIGKTLTHDQEIQAARKLVKRTQFLVDPQDLPTWADSATGKLVAQFRSFGYKQTSFVFNEVLRKAWTDKNFAPLARTLTIGAPMAAGAAEAKDFIRKDLPAMIREKATGEKPEAEEDTTSKSQQVGSDILQAINGSSGGLPGSSIQQLMQGYKFGSPEESAAIIAGGPTLGLVAETTKNYWKGKDGNWNPLKKQSLRKIPGVGPSVANGLMPAKPFLEPTKPGTTSDKPKSNEQKKVDAKAEKTALEAKAGEGYTLQKLSNDNYAYTLDGETEVNTTNTLKDAREKIAMHSFNASGKDSKVVGNKYYYRNENDEPKSTFKFKHDFDVADSQNQLDMYVAKGDDDYDAWNKSATKQLSTLETLKKRYNQESQEDKVDDVQKKIETLKAQMEKFSGYGGAFKKGGSGKGGRRSGGSRGGRGGSRGKAGIKVKLPKVNFSSSKLAKISPPKIAVRRKPTYAGAKGVKKLNANKTTKTKSIK